MLARIPMLLVVLGSAACASAPERGATPDPLYHVVELALDDLPVATLAIAVQAEVSRCAGTTSGVWTVLRADTAAVPGVLRTTLRRGRQPAPLVVNEYAGIDRERAYLDSDYGWQPPEERRERGTDRLWLEPAGEWPARRDGVTGTWTAERTQRGDTTAIRGTWRADRPLHLRQLAGPPCPPW